VTASGGKLGGAVVADDATPDDAIAGAFAPNLTADQLRHLPAWSYETIDPVAGLARSSGFAEVRKALASTRADFLFWDLAPDYDETIKRVAKVISSIDVVHAFLRALLSVDPLSLDEFTAASHRRLSRILREIETYLPDQGLERGENARRFIMKQMDALIVLRGPFAGVQERFSSSQPMTKPRGKTWEHLKPLLCTVYDILSRHNVPTGFRNTDLDWQSEAPTRKTSNVGRVTFALTKLLDERMRPRSRDSVERLYRRIRPAIQSAHEARRQGTQAVGTASE
jgi:hypothetical protein